MTEEKIPSTVTPIKKASNHQHEESAPEVEIDGRNLKSFDITFNGREKQIQFDEETGEVFIDGKLYSVDLQEDDGVYFANVLNNHTYKIEYHGGRIFLEGRLVDFNFIPSVPKLERKKSARKGETVIEAPLPGTVSEIAVKIGDDVSIGQKLLVLEAMKMQNDILSDESGTIKEILVKKGELVSSDQKLIIIKNNP